MQTDDTRNSRGAAAASGQAAGKGPPAETVAPPARSGEVPPADKDEADDGRFEVAEEINTDQQSDAARRVGRAPAAAPVPAGGPPAASGTLSDALDSERQADAAAGAAGGRRPPGKDELRLMADTMPGAGPGGD